MGLATAPRWETFDRRYGRPRSAVSTQKLPASCAHLSDLGVSYRVLNWWSRLDYLPAPAPGSPGVAYPWSDPAVVAQVRFLAAARAGGVSITRSLARAGMRARESGWAFAVLPIGDWEWEAADALMIESLVDAGVAFTVIRVPEGNEMGRSDVEGGQEVTWQSNSPSVHSPASCSPGSEPPASSPSPSSTPLAPTTPASTTSYSPAAPTGSLATST